MRHAPAIALALALLAPLSAPADEAQDAAALAALRAVIADPYAAADPVLAEYGFSEAQYLVDALTGTERRALARAIRDHGAHLPGAIETAIIAKASRPSTNRG